MVNETTKRPQSKGKKALKIIAILLAVFLALEFVAGYFMYSIMLRTDSVISRKKIEEMLVQKTGISTQFFGLNKETIEWFNVHGEDKVLHSADGLELHGTYFENEQNDHRYAVICHGYSGRGRQMVGFVQEFLDRGFAVLAPDARCHGNSEGVKIGMGYFETADLLLWISEVLKWDSEAQIVLLGVSMGAATVLMASGEANLPQNVKAIVSDCAYTDAAAEFRSQSQDVIHVPAFPIVNIASLFCNWMSGYSFKEASPLEAVKKSHTPTLFIHGEADAFVPYAMLEPLYTAAACEKQKLSVPNATHGNSAGTDPALYWSTVEDFVEQYVDMDVND